MLLTDRHDGRDRDVEGASRSAVETGARSSVEPRELLRAHTPSSLHHTPESCSVNYTTCVHVPLFTSVEASVMAQDAWSCFRDCESRLRAALYASPAFVALSTEACGHGNE